MNHIENSFSTHQSPSKEKLESIMQMARDGAWDSVLVEVENLLTLSFASEGQQPSTLETQGRPSGNMCSIERQMDM